MAIYNKWDINNDVSTWMYGPSTNLIKIYSAITFPGTKQCISICGVVTDLYADLLVRGDIVVYRSVVLCTRWSEFNSSYCTIHTFGITDVKGSNHGRTLSISSRSCPFYCHHKREAGCFKLNRSEKPQHANCRYVWIQAVIVQKKNGIRLNLLKSIPILKTLLLSYRSVLHFFLIYKMCCLFTSGQ